MGCPRLACLAAVVYCTTLFGTGMQWATGRRGRRNCPGPFPRPRLSHILHSNRILERELPRPVWLGTETTAHGRRAARCFEKAKTRHATATATAAGMATVTLMGTATATFTDCLDRRAGEGESDQSQVDGIGHRADVAQPAHTTAQRLVGKNSRRTQSSRAHDQRSVVVVCVCCAQPCFLSTVAGATSAASDGDRERNRNTPEDNGCSAVLVRPCLVRFVERSQTPSHTEHRGGRTDRQPSSIAADQWPDGKLRISSTVTERLQECDAASLPPCSTRRITGRLHKHVSVPRLVLPPRFEKFGTLRRLWKPSTVFHNPSRTSHRSIFGLPPPSHTPHTHNQGCWIFRDTLTH